MLTVLVDYESGNLHSAAKAFERMSRETGAGEVIVSSDPRDIARADRIVLPGDGAFPACRSALDRIPGVFDAITEAVTVKGRPFFGICIGMQMLASVGREYSDTAGFGWIPGEVVRITPADPSLKIPHMGWNDLVIDRAHPVLAGIATDDHAYFVHSYHFRATDPVHRLAHVEYAGDITAIVARDNVFGTQFHPEKSQKTGLRIIENFLAWQP